MTRFGERLKVLRESRGLSVRKLGRELGYDSHAYLSMVETGAREPSLDLVRRVARYFGVSYDWLLAEDEEPAT